MSQTMPIATLAPRALLCGALARLLRQQLPPGVGKRSAW